MKARSAPTSKNNYTKKYEVPAVTSVEIVEPINIAANTSSNEEAIIKCINEIVGQINNIPFKKIEKESILNIIDIKNRYAIDPQSVKLDDSEFQKHLRQHFKNEGVRKQIHKRMSFVYLLTNGDELSKILESFKMYDNKCKLELKNQSPDAREKLDNELKNKENALYGVIQNIGRIAKLAHLTATELAAVSVMVETLIVRIEEHLVSKLNPFINNQKSVVEFVAELKRLRANIEYAMEEHLRVYRQNTESDATSIQIEKSQENSENIDDLESDFHDVKKVNNDILLDYKKRINEIFSGASGEFIKNELLPDDTLFSEITLPYEDKSLNKNVEEYFRYFLKQINNVTTTANGWFAWLPSLSGLSDGIQSFKFNWMPKSYSKNESDSAIDTDKLKIENVSDENKPDVETNVSEGVQESLTANTQANSNTNTGYIYNAFSYTFAYTVGAIAATKDAAIAATQYLGGYIKPTANAPFENNAYAKPNEDHIKRHRAVMDSLKTKYESKQKNANQSASVPTLGAQPDPIQPKVTLPIDPKLKAWKKEIGKLIDQLTDELKDLSQSRFVFMLDSKINTKVKKQLALIELSNKIDSCHGDSGIKDFQRHAAFLALEDRVLNGYYSRTKILLNAIVFGKTPDSLPWNQENCQKENVEVSFAKRHTFIRG